MNINHSGYTFTQLDNLLDTLTKFIPSPPGDTVNNCMWYFMNYNQSVCCFFHKQSVFFVQVFLHVHKVKRFVTDQAACTLLDATDLPYKTSCRLPPPLAAVRNRPSRLPSHCLMLPAAGKQTARTITTAQSVSVPLRRGCRWPSRVNAD